MGRTPAEHNPLNLCAAVQAGFPGAAVNLKVILEFSPPVHRIQAGPLMHNSGVERLPDGVVQPLQFRLGQGIDRPPGIDFGDETAFIGVNVANPGDKLLVE